LQNFSRIPRMQAQPIGHRKALAIATAIFSLPLIALAVTELAGVPRLFHGNSAKVLDRVQSQSRPQKALVGVTQRTLGLTMAARRSEPFTRRTRA
jgi:hypothetical protein